MYVRAAAILLVLCVAAAGLSAQATWTGATSTSWNVAGNWSTNAIPTSSDDVIIPPTANSPVLQASPVCVARNVTISAGATLNGGSGQLDVYGNWVNDGTFSAGTGTTFVRIFGPGAATIGGTSTTTFNRLVIEKDLQATTVTMQSPVVVAYAVLSTTTPALDIRRGQLHNGGQNLSVVSGTTAGTSPSAGELHVSGGTVQLNNVYQFSQIKRFFITGGDVTISGQHDIVNSSHRCDVSGGTLTYTRTGALVNLRLTSNNGISWGFHATGGVVTFHGSITSGSNETLNMTGTSVARFVGSENSTVQLINSTATATSNFAFPRIEVAKTNGARVTFDTPTTGTCQSNVPIGILDVAAGGGINLAGRFTSTTGYRIGSFVNQGAIGWNSTSIYVAGNMASAIGAITDGNGTVTITGTGPVTLSGPNSFNTLVCTTAGRQLTFEAGSTTTINGLLLLQGTAVSPILLRSTTPTQAWNLNDAGVEYVRYVDVQDSHAATQVVNAPGGVNSGNNVNWNFGGALSALAEVGVALGTWANNTGGGTGFQAGRFAIDNSSASPITLNSLSITASGTGDDATAYTEVAVYRDNAAGGTAGSFDSTDTLWGTAASAFPANDGTLIFNDSLIVAPAESHVFFVVVKLNGTPPAATNHTFKYTVSAMNVTGGIAAGVPTLPMEGLVILAPSLVATYPAQPANTGKQVPPTYQGPGNNGFESQRFVLNNSTTIPINVVSVTLTSIGTASTSGATTALSKLEIYEDTNGSNVWDAGDTKIGATVTTMPFVVAFSAPDDVIPAMTSRQYFVIAAFNAPTLPTAGQTFNWYISTMSVNAGSFGTATFSGTGIVRNGATINTASNPLYADMEPTPLVASTPTDTGPGGNGIHVGSFPVTNIGTAAGTLTGITIGMAAFTGTFAPQMHSEVMLFQDTNNSGAYEFGVDAQVGTTVLAASLSTSTTSTTATVTFTPAVAISIAPLASERFLIVVKYNGPQLAPVGRHMQYYLNSATVGTGAVATGFSTPRSAGAIMAGNQINVSATAGVSSGVLSTEQGPGNNGFQAGTFTIGSSAATGSEVHSISLTASGTGNDATAFTSVAIYQDSASGTVGSFDFANDILVGTAPGFPADNGTIVFNVPALQQLFASNETRTYFVVVRLNGSAAAGQSFNYQVSAVTVNSGTVLNGVPTVTMNGLTIQAASTFTFTDNSPATAQQAAPSSAGHVIQRFQIGYAIGPANTLTSLTFTGTAGAGGVLILDITQVALYRDSNSSGTFDASDVQVALVGGFNLSNQAVFTWGGAESNFTASATPRQYFVVVAFGSTPPNNATYRTQLTAASGEQPGTSLAGIPAPSGGPSAGLIMVTAPPVPTWMGTVSGDWNTAANWSHNAVPTSADDIVIPANPANPATLLATSVCRKLTIEAGATLNGGSGTLNLYGDWINNGSFVAGTSIVNFRGDTNTVIGGNSNATFHRLFIEKTARTIEVQQQVASVVVTFTGTVTGTPAFDIRSGTYRNGGNDLTVATGVTAGSSPATGELHISGGTVRLDTVYQFSQLKQFTVTAGNVTISGQHRIVNGGHYFNLVGGTVTWTSTLANSIDLLSNNGTQGGWYATGGVAIFHGGVTSATSNNTFWATGTSVVRFIGTSASVINIANTTLSGSQRFDIWDCRVEKTGSGSLTFQGTGTAMVNANVTVPSLTVTSGAVTISPANFGAGFGWVFGSINNSGTVAYASPHVAVTGNITTNAGGTMSGTAASTVTLTGSAPITLSGSNGFHNLTCTQGGKQITFQASSTTTVAGALTLTGATGNLITLRSSSTGVTWNLNNTGTNAVSFVDVRDSVATNPIINAPGGVDSGNNTNWFSSTITATPQAGTAQQVYSDEQGPGNDGIQAGSFTLATAASGGGTLNSITIRAAGSGNDATAYSQVALYRDSAVGAVGSFDVGNDIMIGTAAAAFPADNGDITFGVQTAEGTFTANQSRTYFVVVKLNGSANPGQTFQYLVQSMSVTNAGPVGVPSTTMNGLTIRPPQFTIADTSSATQAIAYAGQGGGVVQQFTVSYPAGPANTLTTINVTGTQAAGGDLQLHVVSAQLYRDDNANSTFEAATDVLVDTQPAFSATNQVTFSLSGTESQFTSGTTREYFIVLSFDSNTPHAAEFASQIMSVSGATAGTTINGTPAPAAGPTIGLVVFANVLTVGLNGPNAAATVNNDSQGPFSLGHVLWDGTFSIINNDWTINQLTFTGTGTANASTAYSYIAVFEDANNNGTFDGVSGGDLLAVPTVGLGFDGSGSYTAQLLNTTFSQAAPRRMFLVVKLAGTALTGETLNAELTGITATPPAGGVSSGDFGVSSTALIIDLPSITVSNAPGSPVNQTLLTGTAHTAEIAKFRFAAINNTVDVTGMTITTGGSGDWVTDIAAGNGVSVYLDNGDGAFDDLNDSLLFASGGGATVNAVFTSNVTVSNGAEQIVWVVIILEATAGSGEATPVTFNLSLASASDVSVAGGASVLFGSPAPVSATVGVLDFFVTSFDPQNDLQVGGKPITITGSGFQTPFVVRIGGIVCPGTAVVTPTQVTGLLVPAGSGANLPIEINSGSLAVQTLTQVFTYSTVSSAGGGGGGGGGCFAGASGAGLWMLAPATFGLLALRRRRRNR